MWLSLFLVHSNTQWSGNWTWCHYFYINFLTSTSIFCSSLTKVVEQKGNVNFLYDFKSESHQLVFNHPSFSLPSDTTDLVTDELVVKRTIKMNKS